MTSQARSSPLPPAASARLRSGPDPERSGERAREALAAAHAADPARCEAALAARGAALGDALFALCAAAPFFVPWLRREPGWLLALAEDDLAAPRSLEALRAGLAAALTDAPEAERAARLRRFKYRELARITVRECSAGAPAAERVPETLAELSALAEALLARVFDDEAARLAAELGPPEWRTADGAPQRLRFAVLGLGKLGGEELNYSSDVDLVYVSESPPLAAGELAGGPAGLTPNEYFARLARRFGRAVEETTADGFLYRVDLDLRPEGEGSALVAPSDVLADYYDGWAATWEKAAFMKARPVAGDLAFGWSVVRGIHPMIYTSSMDLAGVAAIREMKARVEREHAHGDGFHVKLGRGGIRELEFVAQALQLLHGGRMPQVRGRSAPGALRALAQVDALPRDAAAELDAAYTFLRRLENRLQMEGERQVHVLPPPGPARERVARTLYAEEAVARLDADLARHTGAVHRHFEALFAAPENDRVLDLFARSAPRLLALAELRPRLEALASRIAAEIEGSPNPERALNNLDRFVQAVGSRSFYYGLLLDRPELVPRLVRCFAESRFLSDVLARLPELIEPVFADPAKLVPSRAELETALAELRTALAAAPGRAPEEVGLAALRLFQQRELVNVGLLDLAEKLDPDAVEAALSDVAEVCLAGALDEAHAQLARTAPRLAAELAGVEFLVVGLGKLGSRELSYGSDLDVIFLFDAPGRDAADALEAQVACGRLAQKLGWALQTRTAEGVCYEVDARLRPSGNQGMLVTSLAGFEQYHRESAWLWERQSLLRARPVAGSRALGERFAALRRALLALPLPPDAEAEIHRIRARMEDELAREDASRRNLKTGRGGLLDVESVVQALQLRHGAAHPDLLEVAPIALLLERLAAVGALSAADAATLGAGWRFLQRLASRLRIVENRSIHDLRDERGDLDSVARALGYQPAQLTGAARVPLLEDYARHTEAIRAVYARVLGVDPDLRPGG